MRMWTQQQSLLFTLLTSFSPTCLFQEEEKEDGEETKAKLQTVNARLLAQIEQQVRYDEVPMVL